MRTSAILATILIGSVSAFAPSGTGRAATHIAETQSDLKDLAKDSNPLLGFYDPLDLANAAFWGQSQDFTIGWLRQAEIKHGRVAMAAFVGYIVQSNIHWPWPMTMSGMNFPSTDMSPPEQWDAIPFASKIQIILFVGFLEFYSELTPGQGGVGGQTHYTKGGQIGKFPTFDAVPHYTPYNLYDPFNIAKKMPEEKKEKRLIMELNNGRLAMIGIFGFLCAQTIPGSVPLLVDVVKPYDGEVMATFASDFSLLSQ